ncbi:DUF5955 family protein [Streptomyces sp. ACA25]|uniref:DUF5955 family protein n=1 Tax=Streptomyces sp. ACA25 TaxID=3022596 RepID=UPI0023081FC5|nr:DUF5955 family protein [Streptomyces sp. ACA25]MDB1089214.1 DUF5955 family protein [Streptomyces sp. ACA25]
MAAGKADTAHSGTVERTADPRLLALQAAVERLRVDLDAHRTPFADREVAERELAVLDAALATGMPEGAALRHGLLLIAAAVGSVSALVPALRQLRAAVDLFGPGPQWLPAGRWARGR